MSSAAIVVNVAKPAIHSRMRPTGYHSISGAAGGSVAGGVALATCRPSNTRWPSHQAGSATVTAKAMQ
ncbi:hypothetical protein ACVWXO_007565 [Bradyrhizobium sp. LM2.7]